MDNGVDAQAMLRSKEDRIVEVIPFNSARKKATAAIRHPSDPNLVRVFTKGAPDYVLPVCNRYFDAAGNVVPLDNAKRQKIMNDVIGQGFAKKAFRTILLSYQDISFKDYEKLKASHNNFATEKDREIFEKDLIAITITGLQDPLRPEVVQSVKKCHRAGIVVRMVTGDNIDTARAIAIEAGILTAEEADDEYVCMEGKAFREACGGLKKLEDHNNSTLLKEEIGNKAVFRQVAKKLRVMARSTPEDKYMLVTGLKDLQHVVAVTGDGTNDAPALKKADVGFAMGITGTEVAKEASDIILLDDNFASIITAAKWGRNIYTNVRKFLQFQLTVNMVAMFLVFLGGAIISDSPLNAVQMLWVNLIMDTFAALALATEPPSEELLEQPPYGRNDVIVTSVMWRNIFGQAMF
jgi:Ca2+ transporting ATPase